MLVEPNGVLPNAGCDCWNVLPPNGFDWAGVDPKVPKLGFCPKGEDAAFKGKLENTMIKKP